MDKLNQNILYLFFKAQNDKQCYNSKLDSLKSV